MAFSMRRAPRNEIDAIPSEGAVPYIYGGAPYSPDDHSTVFNFYDSWVEAHYAFTGKGLGERSLPHGFFFGGDDWHSCHPDHEPSQLLTSENVKIVANYLIGLTDDVMINRLETLASGNAEIKSRLHPDDVDFLLPSFHEIISFFRNAAENDEAIVKDIG